MIKILNYTKNPLNEIGTIAGACWGADTSDKERNVKRALDCIESGHGRVMEYADVTLEISGYSARAMRELYTYIHSSKLQESTRYVNCANFEYYTPDCIQGEEVSDSDTAYEYHKIMNTIKDAYEKLLKMGMSKEDAANVLPLGMNSKMIIKVNLRSLIHIFNQRLCYRAYEEIRAMMYEIRAALRNLNDDEWTLIVNNYAVPKCVALGYCTEQHQCKNKLMPKKENKDVK